MIDINEIREAHELKGLDKLELDLAYERARWGEQAPKHICLGLLLLGSVLTRVKRHKAMSQN